MSYGRYRNLIRFEKNYHFHSGIFSWPLASSPIPSFDRLFSMQITINNLIKQLRMNYCNAIKWLSPVDVDLPFFFRWHIDILRCIFDFIHRDLFLQHFFVVYISRLPIVWISRVHYHFARLICGDFINLQLLILSFWSANCKNQIYALKNYD